MKLHLQNTQGLNVITGYNADHVQVNGVRHDRPLLLGPNVGPLDWSGQSFDTLTANDFEAILAHDPELVLLGTGRRLRFPAPALTRGFAGARIGFEAMDTSAACRTYNILMGEGRRVVAALLFDRDPQ
ncbi:MAG: Mth938-like domain-containing protein [Proteobacteria bacterium]|nr:Mth938-like domain-containing protein [Burkholderiales bacterium]